MEHFQIVRKLKKEKRFNEAISILEDLLFSDECPLQDKLEVISSLIDIAGKLKEKKKVDIYQNRKLELLISCEEKVEGWKYYLTKLKSKVFLDIETLKCVHALASDLGEIQEERMISRKIFEYYYKKKNINALSLLDKKESLKGEEKDLYENMRGNYIHFQGPEISLDRCAPFVARNNFSKMKELLISSIEKKESKKEVLKVIFDLLLIDPMDKDLYEIINFYSNKYNLTQISIAMQEISLESRDILIRKDTPEEKENVMLQEEYLDLEDTYASFLQKLKAGNRSLCIGPQESRRIKKWVTLIKDEDESFRENWRDFALSFIQMDEYDLALHVIRELGQNGEEEMYLMTEIHYSLGLYQEVVYNCLQTIEKGVAEDMRPHYYLLGSSYLKLNDKKNALRELRCLMLIDPNYRGLQTKIKECLEK